MSDVPQDRHDRARSRSRTRRAVDTHAHWYPADWLRLFERDGPAEGAKLERTVSGYTIRTDRIVNAFTEQFVDLGLRLDGMDRQRVDVHALSLTAPMVYWASPGFGLALAQAYNDAAAAAHARHPDRLVGLAMLPMQSPELALKELERAAKLPGMRGDRKSTRLNSSHTVISYAVFCLKKKTRPRSWSSNAPPVACTLLPDISMYTPAPNCQG